MSVAGDAEVPQTPRAANELPIPDPPQPYQSHPHAEQQPHEGMATAAVPELDDNPHRLTRMQIGELEMARRRAEKAAHGKAQNSAAARRAKRKSCLGGEGTDEELKDKLATVTDEKEAKRLKRLLRNRVSAQQARERKKSYVSQLEERCKEQEVALTEASARLTVMQRENVMLRSVMKNMTGGKGGMGGMHSHSAMEVAPLHDAAVPDMVPLHTPSPSELGW